MRGRILSKDEFAAKLRAELAAQPKPPPPAPRKEASVKGYRQFTHVYSQAVYGAACHDPRGCRAYLGPEPTQENLGHTVREALSASRFITPDHPEWDDIMRFPTEAEIKGGEEDLKQRAGVKTRKALYNGAGSVAVTQRDGEIELHPLRYRGGGAWEGIRGHDPVRLSEVVTDADFGAAVAAAIEQSKNS